MTAAPHEPHRGRASWQRVIARTHLLVSAGVGIAAGAVAAVKYDQLAGLST